MKAHEIMDSLFSLAAVKDINKTCDTLKAGDPNVNVTKIAVTMFATPNVVREAKERGASGHVLAISNYKPETEYTYYWGSGWSKYGFDSMEAWTTYLNQYAQSVRNPLKVEF